eukprot:GFUD01004953.1.p1 GENE.GFUD01004953.1~~GFUD01004953.1.p1  ORF type:complete len:542 (-),score=106.20 GFUD01004953.1:104-1729(-)
MEGQVVQLKAPITSYTRELLSRLWEDPDKDCTIYCQNGQLKVHIAVLASISPVFRDTGQFAEDIFGLSLPEITLELVSAVVKLLYLGTVIVSRGARDLIEDVVINLLQIPMHLDIEDLNYNDIAAGDDYLETCDTDEGKLDETSSNVVCKLCNNIFEDYENLRIHVKSSHERTNSSIKVDSNLDNHLPTQEDAFSLYLKPKRKHSKRNLPEQANVNYQEAIKILVCGVCGISTDNFYPLMKKHYETVHFVKEEKTYYCPTQSCNKKIASTNSFHSHIHIVHREASHQCEHCTKKFKTSGSLAHHTARWHTSDRPLVCQECGEGIASALHLEAHMRMHKSKHICTVCSKKFLSASHLEKHRVTHTSDRPYMCGTCGKTFRDPYSVKECEMKHQGIKKLKPSQLIPWRNREAKFVCDTCGYRTKGKAALDRHIKGKHSSERPYQCKECGKDFKSRSSLEGHESVHGEKITGVKKPKLESQGDSNLSQVNLNPAKETLESDQLKYELIERPSQQEEMQLPLQTSRPTTAYFWMPHSNLAQTANL